MVQIIYLKKKKSMKKITFSVPFMRFEHDHKHDCNYFHDLSHLSHDLTIHKITHTFVFYPLHTLQRHGQTTVHKSSFR